MSICLPVLNNQFVVGLRYCAAYTPLLETLVEVYEEALTRCTITNEKLGDKCGVIPNIQEILKSNEVWLICLVRLTSLTSSLNFAIS